MCFLDMCILFLYHLQLNNDNIIPVKCGHLSIFLLSGFENLLKPRKKPAADITLECDGGMMRMKRF